MVPTQQTHARQVKSNFDKCCMQIRNLHTANSAIVYFQYNYHHCQPASQPTRLQLKQTKRSIQINCTISSNFHRAVVFSTAHPIISPPPKETTHMHNHNYICAIASIINKVIQLERLKNTLFWINLFFFLRFKSTVKNTFFVKKSHSRKHDFTFPTVLFRKDTPSFIQFQLSHTCEALL